MNEDDSLPEVQDFNIFEQIKHCDERGEFWYARELMRALGYTNWRNFRIVIEKSQISVENSRLTSVNHFDVIIKPTGLTDYRLDRYACYIIAQNGDAVPPAEDTEKIKRRIAKKKKPAKKRLR